MNEAKPTSKGADLPSSQFRFTRALFHELTRPSPADASVEAENEVALVSPGDLPKRVQQQPQRYSKQHLAQMTGTGNASPELF